MVAGSNKMISDFSGKPATNAYAAAIAAYVVSLGQVTREAKAQVSFAVKRKFLWLWAYEKTPDGTLYLNVTLDRELSDPHCHSVTQVSKNRWNHHVVVKSEAAATSEWLKGLIFAGYEFAQ